MPGYSFHFVTALGYTLTMSIADLIHKWISDHMPTEEELAQTFAERMESFDAYMESLNND